MAHKALKAHTFPALQPPFEGGTAHIVNGL